MMTEINENMSFEEMLDASFKRLRAGETTKGIVTSVTPTEVHLDLGVKYTGIIPHSEMTMDSSVKLEDIVKVGDEIEAIVIKPNDAEGTISLSKVKIDAVKCFDEIEAAEAADEIVALADNLNKYVNDTAPWALAKEEKMAECANVLYDVLETMHYIAVLLQPFCPSISDDILTQLNLEKDYNLDNLVWNSIKTGKVIEKADIKPVFLRLDSEIVGSAKKA